MMASAVLILVSAALTLTAQQLLSGDAVAEDAGGATVRISALKSEDGAVRVALQQHGLDGAWQARQRPQFNTVRADARTGVWLNSSPLHISTGQPAAAMADESKPLFCIVAHGTRDDYFWRLVRGYSRQAALDNGLDVRFVQSPDSSVQAAAIDKCSADGAAVIAATLAAPDAVIGPLQAARKAGSRIITYNSGYEDAQRAGSELHIALDDVEAGRLAGREFNRHETTGAIACLVHEAENVGLETRCDALADAYTGGDVIRVSLPESGDFDEVRAAIAERITDPDQPRLSALLSLNGDTLPAAMQAIVDTQDARDFEVKTGSLGITTGLESLVLQIGLEALLQISLFTIDDAAEAQGYLITAALAMAHSNPLPSEFIQRPLILKATPFVYSYTAALALGPTVRQAYYERLSARLALGEEYFDE